MDAGARIPQARSHGLIVERLGDETLVYDTDTDEAHALSPVASSVLDHCDGQRTIAVVAAQLELPQPTVVEALAQLEECGLVEGTSGDAGVSRRDAMRRVAVIGAAAAAGAPLVKSIVAPTPAQAIASCMSTGSTGCSSDIQCCENCCINGTCHPIGDCFG